MHKNQSKTEDNPPPSTDMRMVPIFSSNFKRESVFTPYQPAPMCFMNFRTLYCTFL